MSASPPVLSPRRRRPAGCCSPAVEPDVSVEQAAALAGVAKALGDPTRVRIVDAVRKSDPEAICQCELLPLFAMSQAGLAKHLRVLVDAQILGSERRGTWTYYYMRPGVIGDLAAWLG